MMKKEFFGEDKAFYLYFANDSDQKRLTNSTYVMKMLSALIQRRHTNVTVTRDFSAMGKPLAKILTSAI